VAKRRKPPTRKRASSPTRRSLPARRPSSRATKPKGQPPVRRIQLKPIRIALVRAVERLKESTPTEAVKITIERLERCLAEFNAICDPNAPDGCGPNMDFPAP
jgi:hypothetical protein